MSITDKVKQGIERAFERADGWVNLMTGVGTDRSKGLGFQAGARLADESLEALFIGDPFANRICRVVPEEAMRQGCAVKTGDAEEESHITAYADAWRVSDRLAAAWTWARVFGGGAIFVGADDGRDPREPLDEANVRSILFLVVLDRRELVPLTWFTDPTRGNFGEPETYQLIRVSTGGVTENIPVHTSRLVRFEGALTTRRRRIVLRGWGESELQRLYDVLGQFNGAWGATGSLLQDASQGVFKIKNLYAMLAADKQDILKTRLEMMDLGRSVARAIMVDSDGESFERTEVGALAGLAAVLDKFLLLLSGAAEIPVTILMGQSPAGLSATGDSDVRWFYDRIKSQQTATLRPRHLRLLRLLCLAHDGPTGGKVPPKLSVEYAPLWQMTPLEEATLRQTVGSTDTAYITAGVLTPEEVAASRFRPEGWTMETTVDLEVRRATIAADQDAAQGHEGDPAEPTT